MNGDVFSFEAHPSRWFIPAQIAAHAAAALVLAIALQVDRILLCALLLLAASVAWLILRGGRECAASRIGLGADGNCRWQQPQRTVDARLRADSLTLPWLIVLRFDVKGRRRARSVILFQDSMRGDDWRHLQVFLRWGMRFNGAASISSGAPY